MSKSYQKTADKQPEKEEGRPRPPEDCRLFWRSEAGNLVIESYLGCGQCYVAYRKDTGESILTGRVINRTTGTERVEVLEYEWGDPLGLIRSLALEWGQPFNVVFPEKHALRG